MPSRIPAKNVGIMCGKITQRKICQRLAPIERAAVIRIGLMFCTPATMVTMIGKMPWLTPKAIFDGGPMPKYRMNSGRMVICGVP